MDVMVLIKNALKKAGLDENIAEKIKEKMKDEYDLEGMNTAVEDAKKEAGKTGPMGEDKFLAAIKEAGLTDDLNSYTQKREDARVAQALKTGKEKWEKEEEEKNKKKLEEEGKKKKLEGMDEKDREIAELKDTIGELKGTMEKLVGAKGKEELTGKVMAELKEAGMDEGYAEFIHVDSEDKIGDAVKNLKERVFADQQAQMDKKLEELGVPKGGKKLDQEKVDNSISEYAESKHKGEAAKIQGKELFPGERAGRTPAGE
jgi:hypothetical protein